MSRAQHTPRAAGVDRLDVLGVGADIADMREGEGDDLAGIGGIGHDLLIAGHRGVEADLADRCARGADAPAPEHRAVGENQTAVAPSGRGVSARRRLRP